MKQKTGETILHVVGVAGGGDYKPDRHHRKRRLRGICSSNESIGGKRERDQINNGNFERKWNKEEIPLCSRI
jgi:hypothetical protein